jgi:hypothetical protein
MNVPAASRFGVAALVLASAWVILFAGVALARMGHPFELDWMGGAFVDHVCRILDGERRYCAPSADYVPFLYAPLYFYASAGVASAVGEGFVPLRLVAFGSTLGILTLTAFWVRRRTGSTHAAAVAVGIHAGCYFLVDTYYDAARADSAFLVQALAALVLLDLGKGWRTAVLAGAVLVSAYLTKQTAMVLAPPFAIAAAIRAPRRGAAFALAFAGLWLGATSLIDAATDGWFSFYTWDLPRHHQYDWSIALDALWIDFRPLWPIFGLGGWLLVTRLRHGEFRSVLQDGAWAGGLLLAALSSRAHLGGAVNVLAPGVLALGLIGALCWGDAMRRGGRTAKIVPALLVVQLALLVVDLEDRDVRHGPRLVDPLRYIPTEADREAGERIVAMLREAEGDVLVPWHGYLPRMAGKRGGAHLMALIDLETERSGRPDVWEALHQEFLDSARARSASLVLLDADLGEAKYRLGSLVYPGYAVEPKPLFSDRAEPDTFQPVLGLRTRPTTVCRKIGR